MHTPDARRAQSSEVEKTQPTKDSVSRRALAVGRDGYVVGAVADSSILATVGEACRELKSSRTTIYGLINAGQLPVVKIGSRTFFRRADLTAFVDRLAQVGLPAKADANG